MCNDPEYETEEALLSAIRRDFARKQFFQASLMNPAFHWFFTQGQEALMRELYIPGVSALLNGIEASIRVTMTQLAEDYDGKLVLSNYRLLSNTLLRKARDEGLPVHKLAFPGEDDFNNVLERKDKNVEVVQLRHDVCHGNILRFIVTMEFEGIRTLTPECLREIAAILLGVSYEWAKSLAEFRAAHRRRPKGEPIPEIPENPLQRFLPVASSE